MAGAHLQSVEKHAPPNYKIEEMLGSGAFSQVYKATHIENHSAIALKIFLKKMCSMSSYEMAAKEIAFMEILEHPNILKLKLYEINKMFRYVHIGTEYAEFGSLRNFLPHKKPADETIIKYVMQQLISALSYLHDMGIFHGDVKPDNILCTQMTENGPSIKIADFGLTGIKLKDNGNMFYTSGSFVYMAPEVLFRYPVDCSCDLWSAGIVMYIMMFARRIFRQNALDREKQIFLLKRRTPPDYSGAEVYSTECNNLVRNLLSYDKQDRLKGKDLRGHPFLNIPDPVIPSFDMFATGAQEHLNSALNYEKEKKHGEALVQGIEGVLKLKIFYNLINGPKERQYLKNKWEEYEKFTIAMQKALVQPLDMNLNYPESYSDHDLRKYLRSKPKLLHGFDMGCDAEMYLQEGQKEQARRLFHQALQILLPLMKLEPESNKKQIVDKRIKRWIDEMEGLNVFKKQKTGIAQDQTANLSVDLGSTSVEAAFSIRLIIGPSEVKLTNYESQ